MKCDQDLCLNCWYDFKKLLWQDELNPRVRCAFGNVFSYCALLFLKFLMAGMSVSATKVITGPIFLFVGFSGLLGVSPSVCAWLSLSWWISSSFLSISLLFSVMISVVFSSCEASFSKILSTGKIGSRMMSWFWICLILLDFVEVAFKGSEKKIAVLWYCICLKSRTKVNLKSVTGSTSHKLLQSGCLREVVEGTPII